MAEEGVSKETSFTPQLVANLRKDEFTWSALPAQGDDVSFRGKFGNDLGLI